jgi:hypothetical protein
MAQAEKKATNIVTMKDVIFMYTSVSKPTEQMNEEKKPPLSDDPLEFHSFEVKILISDTRFKALKKAFKGAKNLPNAKEHEGPALAEKYDFLNAEDMEDDMVLIKFSQSCLTGKKGSRKPCYPIKQIGVKGKVQDIHGLPIDQETNIGHGTKGHFQFRPVETKFGLYLYPHLICVTELVEFSGGGAEEDLDSLGLGELDDADMDKMAAEPTNTDNTVNDDDDAPVF